MNNKEVNGKMIRMSKLEKKFEKRQPAKCNIFVKNIPNTYDQRKFNQVFMQFGRKWCLEKYIVLENTSFSVRNNKIALTVLTSQ